MAGWRMLDESQIPSFNPHQISFVPTKNYLTIISRGHVIINCKLFVNCIGGLLTVCRGTVYNGITAPGHYTKPTPDGGRM